ncbi:MAG: phosphodiester glycosidase family protein [Cyanobacteria bacterium P01_A01_bin.15]
MPLDKKQRLSLQVCVLSGLALVIAQCAVQLEPAIPRQDLDKLDSVPEPTLTIQTWSNSSATQVYMVMIPPGYPVEVAVSDRLKTVDAFAADQGALAVLNGGFFDPNNGQTTSFITVDGSLVANPRDNKRLVDNPDLAPYIAQILNRSEFRRYDCTGGIDYDITVHSASIPNGCSLHSALGAGPQLLPDTSQLEGFTDYANGTLIRDAIGSQQRNARSAIGIKADGALIWVMVAQVNLAGGMTLAELTNVMAAAGAQSALNLDGGSSSSLHVAGLDDELAQTYYGRLDQSGNTVRRPVKSVLLVPRQ